MNWTERLSTREVVGLLAGTIIYGGFYYALSRYFYPVCPVPYSTDFILGPAIPVIIFFCFLFVNMVVLDKVPWFASREKWAFAVSAITAIGWIILLAFSWCVLWQ
jgi:hypothetical protein